MAKFWKVWKSASKLELSDELAYRFNFILKILGYVLFSIMGPIAGLLIYNSSAGIPGWSFEEFLLLLGTFTAAIGIDNTFFAPMTWRTIEKIQWGVYDTDLIRPMCPLALAINRFNPDGLPDVAVGFILINFALIKMGWIFNVVNLASYLFLLGLAVLFLFSLDIAVTALAFLVVKSWVLLNILDEIVSIGKTPISIFGPIGILLFTFIFPVGLAAFYPASALLGQLPTFKIVELAIVALAFFTFSALLWNAAIKKYTSAGG